MHSVRWPTTQWKAEGADLARCSLVLLQYSPFQLQGWWCFFVCFFLGLFGMKLPVTTVDSWISVRPQQCQVKGPFWPQATTLTHDWAWVEAWTVSVSVVVHHHSFWYQDLLGFLLVSSAMRFECQICPLWAPSPRDASASLSFHVTSGGTDGGHRAQGVLGYHGDKPPRGSECGKPEDGGASPWRAAGLRQRPGAECGCATWDRYGQKM